jgi:hypothetical protein
MVHRPSSIAMRSSMTLIVVVLVAVSASAGPADVLSAKAYCSADSVCSFEVTIRHTDQGWDHYVDRYEVIGPKGEVLAKRVLQHPHVDEQPFMRSLTGVRIPASVNEVTIRAHDSVHGFGGAEVQVRIKRPTSDGSGTDLRRPKG